MFGRGFMVVEYLWQTSKTKTGKLLTSGILDVCKLENIIKTFNIMAGNANF